MSPLPIITNVYRCTLNWQAGTQEAANVLHFGPTSASESQIATALDAHVTAAMMETISSNAHAVTVDITRLDGVSPTVQAALANWDGGGGTEYIPGGPVVLSLQTAVRGKSHRGRTFLPFTAETKQNNGQLAVTSLPTFEAAWNTFITAMQAHSPGIPWCVASYKLATSDIVTHVTVRDTLATMKRRQNRVV